MALQIYQALESWGLDVHQITHTRVKDELSRDYPAMSVSYVEDDRLDGLLARIPGLMSFSPTYFFWRATKLARAKLAEKPDSIVHFTSPVSPFSPQFPIPGARVVVGPVTGNIYYPPAFRGQEGKLDKVRRFLLRPCQWVHRLLCPGKRKADIILVAGGDRTIESLEMAGCRPEQFRESLCCGIPETLRDRAPIEQSGPNFRFVHNGRLVPHKGTDRAIRAVARTRNPVHLDIIGRGPTLEGLRKLAADLGVADRVHFRERFADHESLYRELRTYRGLIFPSLAEAHGIVVQEAMMMGLPVVCLDWGGPGLLVTPETGIAIRPEGDDQVVSAIADAMDRLGEDAALAGTIAKNARELSIRRGDGWSDLIGSWVSIYRELAEDGKNRDAPAGSGDRRTEANAAAADRN